MNKLMLRKPKPAGSRPVEKSVWKGAAAGLIGGLAATAAKSLAMRFYRSRSAGKPELVVDGGKHNVAQRLAAGEALHWGLGAAAGAAYGVIAEYYPAATAREGASFGMVLATLRHEAPLPVMGLGSKAQSPVEHTSDIASHVAYGVVTETVRGGVRRLMR